MPRQETPRMAPGLDASTHQRANRLFVPESACRFFSQGGEPVLSNIELGCLLGTNLLGGRQLNVTFTEN
jgi:hypothetical protein